MSGPTENLALPDDPLGSITGLYDRFCVGDERAVSELWKRFFPRLQGLARSTLGGRTLRGADSDDVVQSAFASFWKGAAGGKFDPPTNRDNLWNLLGIITVRKARKLLEREQTAKRGGGRTVAALTPELSPAAPDDGALDLLCRDLFGLLDEQLRGIAALRMMGHTHREIADLLSCSERRIERKLQLIRALWEQELKPA
ncbi:MAG: ECF-type sigma factor [Planctomycetales bacterium]